MSINLNENEYQKVLAAIEADLEAVLKSESASLSKAFPGQEESPAEDASDASAPDESASAAPEAAPDESKEAAPEAPAEAAPEAPAPDASPSEEAPAAPEGHGEEDLESKLAALPDEQLKHLYQAAKQALFARMPSQPEAAPAAPPVAPPVAAPVPPAPAPAMKSDADLSMMKPSSKGGMSSNKANGGPGEGAVKLGKSEDKEKISNLEQKVELMAKALHLVLGQPVRKAITGISELSKLGLAPAPAAEIKLSKSEITAKLTSLDQNTLTKNDRTAINNYYNNFEVSKIAHLLK